MIVSSFAIGEGATGCQHSAVASGNRIAEPTSFVPGYVPGFGEVDTTATNDKTTPSTFLKNFIYLAGGMAIGIFVMTQISGGLKA